VSLEISTMQLILSLLLAIGLATAEDGSAMWLRYAPGPEANNYTDLPSRIIALNATQGNPVYTAQQELVKGFKGIFGKQLDTSNSTGDDSSAIYVGTVQAYQSMHGVPDEAKGLEDDGFYLSTEGGNVTIVGSNERGALYGAFEYLSQLAQGISESSSTVCNPQVQIRWTNEWDNMDGSIERGYAGPSFFFRDGYVVNNVTRVAEYARMLASIRINGIIVNNVNANATLLSDRNIEGLGRLADAMRPYGIQLGISLNFASPQTIGGLSTFDPLDPKVDAWWANITDVIYQRVPDMAGYLVKANSEGQPGPLTYNRTLADGANMFARAVKPHGGIIMFRAFVYDNQIMYSDWKADRANAAVDFFKELDGKFDENVVVQIKYGPIDFQVREPVSPLFSTLRNTSTAIELQITPEYLGQNDHLVYLGPLWKEILETDLMADNQSSKVKDIITGERFKRPIGGYAGVPGTGTNATWLGSFLAPSNLYTYGRLAWNASQEPVDILQDWIRLTFGFDEQVMDTIVDMSMRSWPAYEGYSGNLGVQTLTDILYTHFGPNPASQDNNGWGQWTRADQSSIGMDRTVANGTGNSGQYPPLIADMYENIDTTPDNLLLWFHHVPYTQRLKSGKTVIQHFYDAHYEGAATAQRFVKQWESLEGKIDSQRYENVLYEQKFQAGHSLVWRDAINMFYYNLSQIPDESNRVNNHPYRIEAEDMTLSGYKPYTVSPFETASGYHAIVTTSNTTVGTASANVTFDSGMYDVAVNYYDLIGGRATYKLEVGNQTVGQWIGNHEDTLGHAPSVYLDGHYRPCRWHRACAARLYIVPASRHHRLIQGRPSSIEEQVSIYTTKVTFACSCSCLTPSNCPYDDSSPPVARLHRT
jgi:alpha-glucuronidase